MTDIVERLRNPSRGSPRWGNTMDEAADEIERLRAERDRLWLVCLDARMGLDCAARLERTDARLAQEYRTKVATIDAALKETGHD